MNQLLTRKPRPDGIFCFNDPLAIGAMSRALDEGLRIPEDMAIIGCGNLHYDDALRVPLSSIDQQSRRIGKEAGRIALGILNSKSARKPESVLLEPQLIARASTQRIAAKHVIARSRANAAHQGFGIISSTALPMRQLQLGLKYLF